MESRLLARITLLLGIVTLMACGGSPAQELPPTQPPAQEPVAQEEPTAEPETVIEDVSPIVIGLITDLHGRFVTFGKDIELATKMAVDRINEEGGINGSLLNLDLVDTGGEPDQAVIGLRELVDKGVFAVSGPLSSGEAEVLYAQVGQLEIPVISGTANKEGITEAGLGWAFRNQATNSAIYEQALPAWSAAYGIERVVLVFDEAEPVSADAATSTIPAAAAGAGIEIINANAPITFTRGQTDFSTVVQRIRETEADGIIIMSAPSEAGLIARELMRQGETRSVMGHPAQNSNSFYEQGGNEISDWLLPSILNPASTDADTMEFTEAMAAADPEPPTVPEAANYYDNIMMLASVMRKAGINGDTPVAEARAAIRDGLLALQDYDGVAGQISFAGSGDAQKTIYINVVREGQLQPLQ